MAARSAEGSLKWQFKEARRKRLMAVEDANQARRAANNALFLEDEVARLISLLGGAGVDPHRHGTEMALVQGDRPAAQGGAGRQGPGRRDRHGCTSLCGSRTMSRVED